jgi:Type IV pilin-like G and H, putative
MVRLHWETFGTAALLTVTIGTIHPAAAQSSSPLALSQAEGGKALMQLTRAQQSYYLENSQFSRTLAPLATGVPSFTLNYQQRIIVQNRSSVVHYAIARRPNLKSFVGRITIGTDSNGNFRSYTIVCENNRPAIHIPAQPSIGPNNRPVCAPGTTQWTLNSIATPVELAANAKQTVGMLTRAQQAYYLENARFSSTIEALEWDITPSPAYDYSIQFTSQSAIQYGIAQKINFKSYVGAAAIVAIGGGEFTSIGIVCENIEPGTFRPAPPIVSANGQTLVCAAGTRLIGN